MLLDKGYHWIKTELEIQKQKRRPSCNLDASFSFKLDYTVERRSVRERRHIAYFIA